MTLRIPVFSTVSLIVLTYYTKVPVSYGFMFAFFSKNFSVFVRTTLLSLIACRNVSLPTGVTPKVSLKILTTL